MKIKVIYCNVNLKLNQLTMEMSQKVHMVFVDEQVFRGKHKNFDVFVIATRQLIPFWDRI